MSIDKYINYIVEDLQAAGNMPEMPDYLNKTPCCEPDYIAECERAPFEPMHKLLGIDPEAFPPSCRLDVAQITKVVNAIEGLWMAFNFYPDFPEEISEKLKYDLMVKTIKNEQFQFLNGVTHIDFCEFDSSKCVFGEKHCLCNELYDKLGDGHCDDFE